ncbi:MAG: hypothetical protein HP492_00660 [Nitrospira sp.]|nr:hypothetical protein [Nitrospira sp.]
MSKGSLGIGLIGVGRHGMRYARHLLHDVSTASLKAVCRRHPEQGLDLPGAAFNDCVTKKLGSSPQP